MNPVHNTLNFVILDIAVHHLSKHQQAHAVIRVRHAARGRYSLEVSRHDGTTSFLEALSLKSSSVEAGSSKNG